MYYNNFYHDRQNAASQIDFHSFQGIVTLISDFKIGVNGEGEGCYKLISVENGAGGTVNFVVSPTTYFVDQAMVAVGDRIRDIMMRMPPSL